MSRYSGLDMAMDCTMVFGVPDQAGAAASMAAALRAGRFNMTASQRRQFERNKDEIFRQLDERRSVRAAVALLRPDTDRVAVPGSAPPATAAPVLDEPINESGVLSYWSVEPIERVFREGSCEIIRDEIARSPDRELFFGARLDSNGRGYNVELIGVGDSRSVMPFSNVRLSAFDLVAHTHPNQGEYDLHASQPDKIAASNTYYYCDLCEAVISRDGRHCRRITHKFTSKFPVPKYM